MADLSHLVSKYFAAPMVRKPVKLRIDHVSPEEIGDEKELLPVVYFEDHAHGLVINAQKYGALADAAGSSDVDKWKGLLVRLFVGSYTKHKKTYKYVDIEVINE